MELSFSEINWLAVGASFVAAQVLSTVWFTVLFGDPWAKEYGAADRKQHKKNRELHFSRIVENGAMPVVFGGVRRQPFCGARDKICHDGI